MRPETAVSGIFISYRHADADGPAQHLYEGLQERLGSGRVFKDSGSVQAGADFIDSTEQAVAACDTLLVIIGPDWLDATGRHGQRRLDDPHDVVRREITAALRRGLRIVPVLVEGATMPTTMQLPDELQPLATQLAIELDSAHWERDIERLLADLGAERPASTSPAAVSPPPPAASPPPAPAPRASRGSMLGGWLGGLKDRLLGSRAPRPSEPQSTPATRAANRPGSRPPAASSPAPEKTEWPHTGAPAPSPPFSSEQQREPVRLAAASPQAAKPGDEFTARLVAYLGEDEAAVRDELTQLSPGATPHMGLKTCQWQRGTTVTVKLTARGLGIVPAEQSFVWEGERCLVEFDVGVPEAAAESTIVLKFDVLIDGIVVAMLRTDLQVTRLGATIHAPSSPTASTATSAARTAFASYSSKDRERVLDRVAAVRISAGLDIFMDCLSLNPGEAWKPRLDGEITQRDLFLLFWSADAAESEWVTWEWRTALRRKGKQALQIHPLQPGIKPPEELRDLHFGDVYMLVREGDRASRPGARA